MSESDANIVAPLVVQYYEWLSGHSATEPDALLGRTLTPNQRKLLLARMDDVNVIWGITAPLRNAARGVQSARPAKPVRAARSSRNR